MYINVTDIILNNVTSCIGERYTSYITRPHSFAGWVFAYIGVQIGASVADFIEQEKTG